MILRSEVDFDHSAQLSTFTWFPLGQPRTISYVGGRATLPAQNATIPLERFEWVGAEVLRWIGDIKTVMAPPNVGLAPTEVKFEVDTDPNPATPPQARRYNVYLSVKFPEFGNGLTGFEVTHETGNVTLHSEHDHTIGWQELKMLNELYIDVAYAARNGIRQSA